MDCQDPRASCCKLSKSDSQWLGPVDPLAIPVVQDQSGGSHKATHKGWGKLLAPTPPPPGSLCPLEEPEAMCGVALPWGRSEAVKT